MNAVFTDVIDDFVIDVYRLSSIAPEALDDVVLHDPAINVRVVDVSNLQLAAPRRLQRLDDVKHGGVIHVHADNGERTGRRLWLLANVLESIVVAHDRYTKVAQVGGFLHLLQENPAASRLS